jgi:hypothetical protein
MAMQTIVQVIASSGISLSDTIAKDAKHLSFLRLRVSQQRRATRSPGWAKLCSEESEIHGVINLEWDGISKVLIGGVVTKSNGQPYNIIGDFIAYMPCRHKRRVMAITVFTVS